MDRVIAIRTAALYLPILAVLAVWTTAQPIAKRRVLGAALACTWNFLVLLAINAWAVQAGWWHFARVPAALFDVPMDLLIGWVVLWGALPALLFPRARMTTVIGVAFVVDLALMPLMSPVLRLGPGWLMGECLALVLALAPSRYLARWTAEERHAGRRGAMQAAIFAALMFWLVPAIVFRGVDGSWASLGQRWLMLGGVPLQVLLCCVLAGLAAVREFAERGGGTPIPFDPPRRLVTSGPYAYVANPMQLSATLVMLLWAWLLESWWVAAAAPVAFLYGIGFAEADEHAQLSRRFGTRWRRYRSAVRAWLPRWRPFHPSVDDPASGVRAARLYVAATCGPCSEVARWFAARSPRGLEIVAAESHPTRDLTRVTYDPGDGAAEAEGVAAIGRALEHLHLGWAVAGWVACTPVIRPVLQLLVDGSGGEARLVRRSDAGACAR